jgi:site-specific recombinase XerD
VVKRKADDTNDVTDLAVVEGAIELMDDRAYLIAARNVPPDQHPAAVYLGRLAVGSRRTMRQSLDAIASELTAGRCDAMTLDWSAVRYQHSAAVRAALAEKHAPATVNKMLSALRGVLKECWRLGLTAAEEYHRAADLPAVRGTSLLQGRALSMGELRTLFTACSADDRPAGVRDAAILAVLYGAGLRRSELVALSLSDYRADAGEIRVRRGKGRKARVCHAPKGCSVALNRWLEVRGSEKGPLFCPINKAGKLTIREMTDQAILYILEKRGTSNAVDHFSPHDLRRTYISDLLDAGADISTVQQMAGHANVQTTARYDRRGETTKRKAAELLHVPVV